MICCPVAGGHGQGEIVNRTSCTPFLLPSFLLVPLPLSRGPLPFPPHLPPQIEQAHSKQMHAYPSIHPSNHAKRSMDMTAQIGRLQSRSRSWFAFPTTRAFHLHALFVASLACMSKSRCDVTVGNHGKGGGRTFGLGVFFFFFSFASFVGTCMCGLRLLECQWAGRAPALPPPLLLRSFLSPSSFIQVIQS
ncbi:uncharacterized protein J3D65DRAFT_409599 [Phyllosticta citribraziliensis]|uniref:Uncharacterized protein n=1 Tax=Phyllosticta citribraziliensis TaxID=989973 RepID=A0ABR1LM01_9PEZI